MPPERRLSGFVYRWGRPTVRNCTPRWPQDLEGIPGLREPGLSTNARQTPGKVGFFLDLSRLAPRLAAFADDPQTAGVWGHVVISPVDASGRLDLALLQDWARSRDEIGVTHPLTQAVLDAIVFDPGGESP